MRNKIGIKSMIKKQIHDESLKEQLRSRANDKLFNFLLDNGNIRGAVLNGTRMVNEMRANHDLGILETLVLGHAFLGGALISCNLKGNDRIVLEIDCSGPIKGLTVETNAFGEVRGYLKNIPIPIEKPLEDFNLSPFFGAGFLSVTKYLKDAKQPFSGQVTLQYGSIAKDLSYYFLTSEQIPTSMNLSVQFNTKGKVTGAGGLFLQVMPGAKEKTIQGLEPLIQNLPSIGKDFSEKRRPEDLICKSFEDFSPNIIGSYRIEFLCHCSKERIYKYFAMFPADELQDILENGPFPVEITCHYCNSKYSYNKREIEKICEEREVYPNR